LGLGLAIVRHLVELHGGIVTARSDGLEKGAEFTIHLPILISTTTATQEDEARVHPTLGGDSSDALPSLAGLRILVVDDEPEAREIVSAILGEAGAEVATAENARQAVDLVIRWKPHLLISDIGMPNEDGYELIRKVRALSPENGGQIPAVALTAFARTQDRLKVLSAGYQMHVPKPVEPVELATVVASLTKRL
jgi:CheY-like chemotaxis protein